MLAVSEKSQNFGNFPVCAGRLGASIPSMSSAIGNSTGNLDDLIRRALSGDEQALAALFGHYRRRLRQMVRLPLDKRLQGRVDPSDVLQEAYLDIVQQLPSYAKQQDDMSFFLWLRLVTGQRMMCVHREHLGAQMRNAGRGSRRFAASRGPSQSYFGVVGRSTIGPFYVGQPVRHACRDAGQAAGGNQ
jgi:hypothetical protein